MHSSHPTSDSRGVLLMAASVALFAVNILVIRGLSLQVPQVDGWMASLFRGLAGLATVLIVFRRGGNLALRRVFTHPLLALRGILGSIGIVIFYVTVVHLGAGRATVINLTYPMFATLIAAVWLRETLRPAALLWVLAGFLGLCIFLGGHHPGEAQWGYDLLALGGAVVAAFVVVIIRRLHHTEHSSSIYASQCVYGLLLTLPISGPATLTLPAPAWLVLLAVGVVVAFGQLTMTYSYRHLTVSKGASLQMLLPLTTALGGFLLFGETFTPLELAGASLTILATIQILRTPKPTPALTKHPQPSI